MTGIENRRREPGREGRNRGTRRRRGAIGTRLGSRSGTTIGLGLLGLLLCGVLGAQSHRVFVTSTTGSADLSSWADAQGEVGLEAADQICRAHAQRAGLAGASSYVAWISDSVDDAYCRAHGLSGKKSENCGQSQPPRGAGPWMRMDGLPFGGPLEDLLLPTYAALGAVEYDETGKAVFGSYFTGTRRDGTGTASICADWTSTDGALFAAVGSSRAAGRYWTEAGATICSSTNRSLLCLRRGEGPALPPLNQAGARVFITGGEVLGDFSQEAGADGAQGVEAGDAICQRDAELLGLDNAGNYRAWLSDTTTAAIDRIESDGPWVRLDGMPVADDKNDLIDGLLRVPLNLTVDGRYLDRPGVWTGTSISGQPISPNCNNWSSSASTDVGRGGETAFVASFWTEYPFDKGCSTGQRLICIEDTQPTGLCRADANTLCLGPDERFAVRIDWETADETGSGQAVDIDRRDSGLFTFFDPNNLEMLVKVLEGCVLTEHFWVFYGATTDVGFRLTVTDTVTGAERLYTNPLGRNAESVKDLLAFPCGV